MTKFISTKAFERVTRCCQASYHESELCGFLAKCGQEFLELTDDDLQKYKKYLKPCKRCHDDTTVLIKEVWPKAEPVIIWHCSDGRDFSTEVEALRHELDIFRKG